MPYAILRFQKRKAGSVAACERHNERKKEAYKSKRCFCILLCPPAILMRPGK